MKYAVVKTVIGIEAGVNSMVYCNVSLHDDADIATNKASLMYGEIVDGFAKDRNLVASSFETGGDKCPFEAEAKVFGKHIVVVIVAKKVDENKGDMKNVEATK